MSDRVAQRDLTVHGIALEAQTRCSHSHGPLDIIAIRMKCCGAYYACRSCHDALADHTVDVWSMAEGDQPAVLCGACRTELTINEYCRSGDRCPNCGAGFNPGCRSHHQLYFASS